MTLTNQEALTMANDNGKAVSANGSVKIVDSQGNIVPVVPQVVNGKTYYRMPLHSRSDPAPLKTSSEPQPAKKIG